MRKSKFLLAAITLVFAVASHTASAQNRHSMYPAEPTDYEPAQFLYGIGPDTGEYLMNKPVQAGETQWLELQRPEMRSNLSANGLAQSVTVFFAFDSTVPLNPEILNGFPFNSETKIRVIGRTDPIGTDAHNDGLALRRAQTVAQLLAKQGILRSRIEIISLGSRSPIAPNNSEEGRQMNRQVSIKVRGE